MFEKSQSHEVDLALPTTKRYLGIGRRHAYGCAVPCFDVGRRWPGD